MYMHTYLLTYLVVVEFECYHIWQLL